MARTQGSNISAEQSLILEALENDTFFYENVELTGTLNSSNTVFTLPAVPNPALSLDLIVNGQSLTAGGVDYTLSGDEVTLVHAPDPDDVLRASFRVDPT